MRTFDVTGPVAVSVECSAGEVRVATHDAPTAQVELRALRDDDATRDAIARTRVELRDGRDLVVEVPRRVGSFLGRDPQVGIDIRVPHDGTLSFATASADVDAAGRYAEVRGRTASGDVRVAEAGSVRVESASGELRAETVHGEAVLKTASGDIELDRAGGPVTAHAVSGDVRVGSVAADLTLSVVSGDAEVDSVAGGTVDVRSVSGDVTLGVAPGARVRVDVSTVSGDLRSDVELGDTPPAGDDDGPLIEIRGHTVSGDLLVRRARIQAPLSH